MKTLLFLDDWMLDSYTDVVRRFCEPEQLPLEPVTEMYNYATVIRDPERGGYRCWYNRFFTVEDRAVSAKCLAESEDGYNWQPVVVDQPVDRLGHLQQNLVFSGHTSAGEGTLMLDPRDPDPGRRYKLTYSDRLGPWDVASFGLVAHSRDGIHWTLDRGHPFYTVPGGCDTLIYPLFNPVTGQYQAMVRPSVLDRRVAIVQSPDFRTWTQPLTVLTPDPMDEPCLQFYGMPCFCYEDLFIGLLWDHHVSQDERMGVAKWGGVIDCELAYSYNGVNWNRTTRRPFIGRTPPGTYGCGSIYPHSLLVDEHDSIRIYSGGTLVDHALEAAPAGFSSVGAMLVHRLRKDGFACLEPRAGWGTVTTRCVRPRSGDIAINLRAPVGQVLVQISEKGGSFREPLPAGMARKPIPGFSFEECIPLTGDELYAQPRWRNDPDCASLIGQHVRLELKLFQAQLYAVRWDVQPWYGDLPIERI
jgi:hypothetical protein